MLNANFSERKILSRLTLPLFWTFFQKMGLILSEWNYVLTVLTGKDCFLLNPV